jgi:8-oxo-dGTP diphosphatase
LREIARTQYAHSCANLASVTWDDFWKPSVAVDVALLTVANDALCVLLHQPPDGGRGWSLPGTFLHEGEVLADAALRALEVKAGVRGEHPRQLGVFDAVDRDDRGRVLSVAHVDLITPERLQDRSSACALVPVNGPQPLQGGLAFDHDQIVGAAVDRVRAGYEEAADPFALLPEPFTLSQLRHLHEAVLARPLQRDTFRRRMGPQLHTTGEVARGSIGRPTELFTRHS